MSQTQLQFVYRRKCESDKSQLGLGDHESNSTVTEVNFSDFLKKPFTQGKSMSYQMPPLHSGRKIGWK